MFFDRILRKIIYCPENKAYRNTRQEERDFKLVTTNEAIPDSSFRDIVTLISETEGDV